MLLVSAFNLYPFALLQLDLVSLSLVELLACQESLHAWVIVTQTLCAVVKSSKFLCNVLYLLFYVVNGLWGLLLGPFLVFDATEHGLSVKGCHLGVAGHQFVVLAKRFEILWLDIGLQASCITGQLHTIVLRGGGHTGCWWLAHTVGG